jgi:hypothetical protein
VLGSLTVRELILERQEAIRRKLEALQAVAYQDSGGQYPTAEVATLGEQIAFLKKLADAAGIELDGFRQARRGD